MKLIRFAYVFAGMLVVLNGATETPAGKLWTEFKSKRDKLVSVHQEFEVSRTSKTASHSQSSQSQIVLDMSQGLWREKSISGSGNRLTIFDGSDLFSMEEGGDEYIRVKRHPKDPDPAPSAYLPEDADWSKSQEVERRPCGFAGNDRECVILEVRLKPWTRTNPPNNVTRMSEGSAQMVVDTQTGLVLLLRIVEAIQGSRSSYQRDVVYRGTRVSLQASADANLFKLPSEDMREVKELSRWNAAKIKKRVAGRPAPELN